MLQVAHLDGKTARLYMETTSYLKLMAEGDHFSTSHNLIECSVDQLAFTQDAFG
jgi:hypothetical protein